MKICNLDDLHDYMKENLLNKRQAMKITCQSAGAFMQAEKSRMFSPFFETDGKTASKVKLYLKSDMEEYARNKRKY